MIDYLLRFTSFIDMFDTILIITLFLLALLLVYLLTLRLSIKHLCLFIFVSFMSLSSFIADINGFFEIPTPLFILTPRLLGT